MELQLQWGEEKKRKKCNATVNTASIANRNGVSASVCLFLNCKATVDTVSTATRNTAVIRVFWPAADADMRTGRHATNRDQRLSVSGICNRRPLPEHNERLVN